MSYTLLKIKNSIRDKIGLWFLKDIYNLEFESYSFIYDAKKDMKEKRSFIKKVLLEDIEIPYYELSDGRMGIRLSVKDIIMMIEEKSNKGFMEDIVFIVNLYGLDPVDKRLVDINYLLEGMTTIMTNEYNRRRIIDIGDGGYNICIRVVYSIGNEDEVHRIKQLFLSESYNNEFRRQIAKYLEMYGIYINYTSIDLKFKLESWICKNI